MLPQIFVKNCTFSHFGYCHENMKQLHFVSSLPPFSRDGLSIISGSEDNFIYVWKTHHDVSKLSSARRDRNEFYESFTSEQWERGKEGGREGGREGEREGGREKGKKGRRERGKRYSIQTSSSLTHSAHHAPVTAAVFAPVPGITVDQGLKEVGQMIVAADYQGCIKVYVNTEKL